MKQFASVLPAALALALFHPSSPGAAASAWASHRDAAGTIVSVPPGWQVVADVALHKTTLRSADGSTQAVVRIVDTRDRLDGGAGAAVAAALSADAEPRLRWEAPRAAGGTVARLEGASASLEGRATFAWVPAPQVTVGYLFEATAPRGSLAAARTTFDRIFGSVRLARPAAASNGAARPVAGPALEYVTFNDPRERAFAVALPRGWKAAGGAYRASSVDVRMAWAASAPDHSIEIAGGDPNLGYFTLPNAWMREGTPYQTPGGTMIVRRYDGAAGLLAGYLPQRLGSACSHIGAIQTRPRPDALAPVDRIAREVMGVGVQVSAAEMTFTCESQAGTRYGYAFAATRLAQMPSSAGVPGASVWDVPYLYLYLAREDDVATAQAALERAVGSFRFDPGWVARQQGTTMNVSAIATQTQRDISNLISEGFRNRSAVMDRTMERGSDARRGVQNAYDPVLGDTFKIDNRYAYNFIDHSGKIAGSDVDASPGYQYRRLVTGI